jgi:hypothetical protein
LIWQLIEELEKILKQIFRETRNANR